MGGKEGNDWGTQKVGWRGRKITEIDQPAGGFTHLLLTKRQEQL